MILNIVTGIYYHLNVDMHWSFTFCRCSFNDLCSMKFGQLFLLGTPISSQTFINVPRFTCLKIPKSANIKQFYIFPLWLLISLKLMYFFKTLLYSWVQIKKMIYIVKMTKEGSIKIVKFMTPSQGFLC